MVIGLDDILLDCVHFLLLLLVIQLVELLLGPQQVVSRLDQKLFNILFVLSLRRMLVLTFELHLALEHGLNLQVGLLDFVSQFSFDVFAIIWNNNTFILNLFGFLLFQERRMQYFGLRLFSGERRNLRCRRSLELWWCDELRALLRALVLVELGN